MGDTAYLNGEFMPLGEARVSVCDRAFLFGDGVYEVIRGYGGRLYAFDAHWQRLARSLQAIAIRGVDLDALRRTVTEAVRRAAVAEPLVYLQVSRGAAPRRHTWDDALQPTILVTVTEAKGVPAEQQAGGVACITQPDLRWARCDIKSLNLLPNVMAKQRAIEAGAFEAILYEADGSVTEGSSTSVFMVAAGALVTHPETARILPGITRTRVLALTERLGLETREVASHVLSLRRADEVFLAGTTTEVLAVSRIDGDPVGDGLPGPITRRVAEAFAADIAAGS